jgi:hypothetical protein
MVGSTSRFAIVATVVWMGCAQAPPRVADPIVVEREPVAPVGQPESWVLKLGDFASRASAVSHLSEMFEEVVLRANGNLAAPEVRDFVNKTLEPLSKLYVEHYHLLDTKTRVATIKLLAAYRDERTEPALKKAFEAFAQAPTTSRDETDVKWASQAQEELRIESLSMPLLAAFLKLRASSMIGGVAYRDVKQAISKQAPSKAWVEPLIATLEAEMIPVDVKHKESFDEARDQVFWHETAAEALGRIGDPRAVEPLYKVLLDPAKLDVSYTAGLALMELGRPALHVAIKLLKSEHEKLQAFQVRRIKEVTGSEPKAKPWIRDAARVLGAIGRPEAVAPLIAAVEAERDDELKVVLAEALTRVPGTPESKAAFKRAFRHAPFQGVSDLSERIVLFFDPELVPWILESAGELRGPKSSRETAQTRLLGSALRLAMPSQMGSVKAAARKLGASGAEEQIAKVEPLVADCKDDASCYLAALTNSENQSEANQIIGIKAGYTVAILGNAKLRDELIQRLGQITNPALRHVAAQTIDHLTGSDSRVVGEKLRRIIEQNAKSPDKDKAFGDHSVKYFMVRLLARAS